MEIAPLAVIAVIVLVVVSVFARRLGVAAPVILVVLGIGIALLPGAPAIDIPPEVILETVLPPLLYSAAIRVPVVDLRRNFRSISVLSVFLVIGSAFAVAGVLYRILPRLDFGAALALGAVVSPTDAVAATAVAKRLGLPPRLVTLLEGESLVNDASALVLLKVALGTTGAAITASHIVGSLAYAIAVSLVIGIAIGAITVRFRSRLKDPVLDSVVSFAVPFVAYIPVEALGASGVLAVVATGIYSGHAGVQMLSARARLSERVNWSTVQFVLENGVFLLMGLQLKKIVQEVLSHSSDGIGLWGAVLLGLLIAVVLLFARVLFVAPVIWQQHSQRRDVDRMGERLEQALTWLRALPDQATGRGKRRVEVAERRVQMRTGDVNDIRRDQLNWRSGIVATWAGMRGVVTLAAAQSLPQDTPYRSALVLIAFIVALATLVVQGGTLPWVIRITKVGGGDVQADDRELASLLDELYDVAEKTLEHPELDLPEGESVDPDVVRQLKDHLGGYKGRLWERIDTESGDRHTVGPHQQYRMLLAQVLAGQREALIEARSRGEYASRVLERAQSAIDAEETRLQPMDDAA